MKPYRALGLLMIAAFAGLSFAAETENPTTAQTGKPAAADTLKPAFQYVNAAKCKRCHTAGKIGGQYKVWLESKHSHAFLTLASDSAKSFAAKKGVEDPQKAAECLQCHVTGYGEPAKHFVAARADSEGVGCESCHGPGSAYWPKLKMQEIRADKAAPEKYGLVIPTKEVCAKCHNEKSPAGTFVDWPADSAKIAHPIPKGYTSDSE